MGYSNRISKMHTCFYGLSFYGILRHLCRLLQTFTDFYRVYRFLLSFLTLNIVFCYCLYLLNLLSFKDFYRYAPKFTSFFVPTSRK